MEGNSGISEGRNMWLLPGQQTYLLCFRSRWSISDSCTEVPRLAGEPCSFPTGLLTHNVLLYTLSSAWVSPALSSPPSLPRLPVPLSGRGLAPWHPSMTGCPSSTLVITVVESPDSGVRDTEVHSQLCRLLYNIVKEPMLSEGELESLTDIWNSK